MPPIAAATGSAAALRFDRCPTVNSRFISSPTTRKKIVRSPSLTQWRSDRWKPASPSETPSGRCQNASNAGPSGELVRTMASTRREQEQDARRRRPAGEVERRHPHAVAEAAEHRVGEGAVVPGAVVAAPVDVEGRREQHAARLARSARRPRRARRAASAAAASASRPRSVGDGVEIVLGQRLPSASSAVMCAFQKVSASGARSTSSAARRARSLPVSGLWRKT